MTVFDINSMSLKNLNTLNAPQPLEYYAAVLLKNDIIIYIGGIQNTSQVLVEANMSEANFPKSFISNVSTPSNSKFKLIIGLSVGIFCLVCFAVVEFLIYKKIQRREIIKIPSSSETREIIEIPGSSKE
ncbi:24579_t:CDS:2 [Dentiscutata erythropus]|uniref:24579_t:CDS:1 n=1 Tax=Dentiscutata erythropus TaxID=1348616 RepID=A0A9N9CFM5_9GLOM|nr:24579_t:CDS:2 [Dentiscutata erythropus]